MKHRICAALLALALAVCLAASVSAAGNVKLLEKVRDYDGRFTDVAGRWHEGYITDLYEYGLVEGRTPNLAAPDGKVLVEELVTLAARLHAAYYGKEIPETEGIWYAPYTQYALAEGVAEPEALAWLGSDATRGWAARILAAALPEEELEAVDAERSYFDVLKGGQFYDAVSLLTKAGVVEGYEDLSYMPDAGLSRAEVFTMLDRMVNKEMRIGWEEAASRSETPETTGSKLDEAMGDYVSFVDSVSENIEFRMNRRDNTFTLRIKLGADSYIGYVGLFEETNGSVLCKFGERLVFGPGTVPVPSGEDLDTLTFRYTGDRHVTLVSATRVDGAVIGANAAGTQIVEVRNGVVVASAAVAAGYPLIGASFGIGSILVGN